jgi:hypothetical protein
MGPWHHFFRVRVRSADGAVFRPIPIKRWRCKPCRRTASGVPAFIHRYLHYDRDTVQEVLMVAVELDGLIAVEGPSEETLNRWIRELLSEDVERCLLRTFPVATGACTPKREARWPGGSRVLQMSKAAVHQLWGARTPISWSPLLQCARLSYMTRYAA